MNKKGQTTLGHIIMAIGVFILLLMGAFNFFIGFTAENEVDLSDSVDEDAYRALFENATRNVSNTADTVDQNKSSTPKIIQGFDFFVSGIDSIKAIWGSVDIMNDYMNLAKKDTPLGYILPTSFWTIVGALVTIFIIFVVLGALWRYNLTK